MYVVCTAYVTDNHFRFMYMIAYTRTTSLYSYRSSQAIWLRICKPPIAVTAQFSYQFEVESEMEQVYGQNCERKYHRKQCHSTYNTNIGKLYGKYK